MSSVRGGPSRGRGRGSTQQPATKGRGASSRGGMFNNASRGNANNGSSFGQSSQSSGNGTSLGSGTPRANASTARTSSTPGAISRAKTTGSWQDRFQTLQKARERERNDAIREGLIADPEKPRSLAEAITPVGTCEDMCPEYERVQRVVQSDVWDEERDPNHSAYALKEPGPDEARMVKKFRRSAAGLEEQLPSDLRPPPVLKRTCDYLFNDMIGNARSLAAVHYFVWDRTRAIRNDFSIQQVRRPEELRTAVQCYERIARFHIMSLHQLALPEKPYSKYDYQQEREQLDRTLLSLMQLYDDSRERIDLPNEAEFRAYCVILQLQDPTPDLEDRVQSWPRHILQDPRVQKALDLYMAACNVMDAQGPLKPRAKHLVARQDWQRFWTLVGSKEISYLMACAAEVYFNLIRRTVLNALFRTSRQKPGLKTPEWTVEEMRGLLAFDDDDEVYTYCERFGFSFNAREDGQYYLDLSSVGGKTLPEPSAGMPKQLKSRLVENKRFGRILPAIIDGLTVKAAQDAGMVQEEDYEEEMDMQDAGDSGNAELGEGDGAGSSDTIDDGESLFVPESKPTLFQSKDTATPGSGTTKKSDAPSPFSGTGTSFNFGKPSTAAEPSSIFSTQPTQFSGAVNDAPKFDFLNSSANKSQTTAAPTFSFLGATAPAPAPANTAADIKPASNPFAFLQAPQSSESIFSKPDPTPMPANTAPPLFQFPTAPAAKQTDSREVAQPVSSVSPLFTGPPPPSTNTNKNALETLPSKGEFSFTQPAGSSAAPLPRQPSQSPEMKASQPHFTTPSNPPASTLNGHASATGLNAGTRKSSFNWDHRPEKPSPLSNSFTVADDSSAAIEDHPAESLAVKKSSQGFPPNPNPNQSFSPAPAVAREPQKPPPVRPEDELETVVQRIADYMYSDPTRGFLEQYVDFHVTHTVRKVWDQLETERLTEEADQYCRFRLRRKYGKRWRDLFWQRRLAKTGRERRERRKRRLLQRSSLEADGGSLLDTASALSLSQASSVSGVEAFGVRQTVEANMLGHSSSNQLKPLASARDTSSVGVKRPMSSHGAEEFTSARQNAHKRMKSTSHVDDRGRVTKPSVTSNPTNDILKRSSFLGFSQESHGGATKNTTKTNYFRLKALGIHRLDQTIAPRGTKRRLSTPQQESSQTSPPALRSSLRRSTSAQSNDRALMPPPSSTPARTPKINDQDEELFARLKAARENLGDNTAFYKDMVKDDELGRSLNSSRSSNEGESPSMAQARIEARSRASHGSLEAGRSTTGRDVPAYRFRESKFVPRENYGKAIERAREIRESRSRETSRPQSPQPATSGVQPPKESVTAAPATGLQKPPFGHSTFPSPGSTALNGFAQKKEQPQTAFNPTFGTGTTSFSEAPISFANHTTQLPTENPFMKAPTADSAFNGFTAQQKPSSKDNNNREESGPRNFTVQPSQINQALTNSFGGSHGHGTNQPLSMPGHVNTPPQQDSYLHSQAISLISDDEDDEPAPPSRLQPVESAGDTEATEEELLDDSADEEEFVGQNGYNNNPYAALARHLGDEEDVDGFDEETEEGEDYVDDDDRIANGYADDEDEQSINGSHFDDYSEGDGQHENVNGSEFEYYEDDGHQEGDYSEEEDFDDEPPPNPALQEGGKSVEEAIELSD